MKKTIALLGALTMGLLLAGCTTSSNSGTQSDNKSQQKSYKYYASTQTFYGPNGTIKINKAIPFKDTTHNNEDSIMLDVTYKNTSKKAMNIGDLFNINIVAHQLNSDGSQNVKLSDSQDISGAFTTDQVDEENRINDIADQQGNELQPGKEMHTLVETGYKLDNNSKDINLSLYDPLAISDSDKTVNPKKNKITIPMQDITANTLNLNDY
ncbi:DUF5067 domain-containing protein [Latilactobacillus sakei]|uniref:DUF5067 domain-containing protein n=1 Tax=Latilactobacillus sakei TaxID=1599 RepID=UPI001300DD4C|nr:DUF5067 domain-containing protein [Latilactobacillus sakei]